MPTMPVGFHQSGALTKNVANKTIGAMMKISANTTIEIIGALMLNFSFMITSLFMEASFFD